MTIKVCLFFSDYIIYYISSYLLDADWNNIIPTGSHHICINLQSTASSGNFCEVTGQSDWCSDDKMQCHKNKNDKSCTPANWCVCQWAFRTYLEKAGGCDQIQDIQVSIICFVQSQLYRTVSYHVGILLQLIYSLSSSLYSYFLFSARLLIRRLLLHTRRILLLVLLLLNKVKLHMIVLSRDAAWPWVKSKKVQGYTYDFDTLV